MISIAVMAHRKRAHFVPDLVGAIGGDVDVVWDERNDRIDTGERAIAACRPGASHHVVIQDDAIVCSNFRGALERIVEAVPDNPVSLYTGRTRPRQHLVKDAVREMRRRRLSWIAFDELYWGVGVVLPVALVEAMRAFHEQNGTNVANYDARMSAFFAAEGIRVFYAQPSLVDHRDVAENPSLVAGRTAGGRVAHTFIGDADPLEHNWKTPAVYVDRRGELEVVRP